ncbi:MAG: sugar-binding domain-containing protein, partial [Bacteroidota bacterium]
MRILLVVLYLLCSWGTACQSVSQNLHHPDQPFNDRWLFYKGDPPGAESIALDDVDWRALDLPHDWAIEGPFDPQYNARTGGLPVHGVAWYRKHFTVPADMAGKVVSVLFDGAMSRAKVWCNGQLVGQRPFGYIGFSVDLTPHIRFGEENLIAVQLSPEDLAARWYPGAGIYRNVSLSYNDPVHIPTWGTYLTTPEISKENALVKGDIKIVNQGGKKQRVQLRTQILDADGKTVAETRGEEEIPENATVTHQFALQVDNPRLWEMETPHLYRAQTQLLRNNQVIDEYETSFGIRSMEASANDGFLLNG